MTNQLLRFNKEQLYCGFDFETKRLNLLRDNEPWQIGYYIAQGDKVEKVISKYIRWPNLDISDDAARITRFNRFEYETKAEDSLEVFEEFNSYLSDKDYIVVFQNGLNFDAYVLNQWRAALGLGKDFSYLDRTIDTNSLARLVKLGIKSVDRKEWYPEFLKMANFAQKGMKTSLKAMAKEFSIEIDENLLHEAKTDIILMQKIFQKLINLIEI